MGYKTNDNRFSIIQVVRNRVNHKCVYKDIMQIDNVHAFVNELRFYKMALMVEIRIDIRTKNVEHSSQSKTSLI